MSGFVFRWATPLRLRRGERDRLRRQLQAAVDDWHQVRRCLTACRGERQAAIERIRRLRAAGRLDLEKLRQQTTFCTVLERRAIALQRDASRCSAEVETRRNRLVEADREVRVIEQLRDRDAALDRQRRQSSESQQLDEVGAQSWLKRRTVARLAGDDFGH